MAAAGSTTAMDQGGTWHDAEKHDASVAPSPTLRHTLYDDGTAPQQPWAAVAARGDTAAEGRLNPFHAGTVPPPAKRQFRPTASDAL